MMTSGRRTKVRGRSESRPAPDLSAGELRSLFEACARAPREVSHQQDSGARRRRDAAFLAIAYGSGVRRAEAIALDVADLDFGSGQLRVRQGDGKKPRQAPLTPSALPALEDWLQVRGQEPSPLFCAVLKTGRLVREAAGGLRRLSGSADGRRSGAGRYVSSPAGGSTL